MVIRFAFKTMLGHLAKELSLNGDLLSEAVASQFHNALRKADSEIVMVDLSFGDDFFEQNRSWDDFGTTIAVI